MWCCPRYPRSILRYHLIREFTEALIWRKDATCAFSAHGMFKCLLLLPIDCFGCLYAWVHNRYPDIMLRVMIACMLWMHNWYADIMVCGVKHSALFLALYSCFLSDTIIIFSRYSSRYSRTLCLLGPHLSWLTYRWRPAYDKIVRGIYKTIAPPTSFSFSSCFLFYPLNIYAPPDIYCPLYIVFIFISFLIFPIHISTLSEYHYSPWFGTLIPPTLLLIIYPSLIYISSI